MNSTLKFTISVIFFLASFVSRAYTPCQYCEGLGFTRITCSQCKGQKTLNCYICDGTGKFYCIYCKNTGYKKCDNCYGKGRIPCGCIDKDNCSDCYGRGDFECSKCIGGGKISCFCGYKIKQQCEKCEGKGKFTCHNCDGLGYIRKKCRKCKGQGNEKEIIKTGKIKYNKNLFYSGEIIEQGKLCNPYGKGTLFLFDKQKKDTVSIFGDWSVDSQNNNKHYISSCIVRFPNGTKLKSSKATIVNIINDLNVQIDFKTSNSTIYVNNLLIQPFEASMKNAVLADNDIEFSYLVNKDSRYLINPKSVETTVLDAEIVTPSYIFKGSNKGSLNHIWMRSAIVTNSYHTTGTLTYSNGDIYEGSFNKNNSYKEGKLTSPNKGWQTGVWNIDNNLYKGSLNWKFDFGTLNGTVDHRTTKGDLYISDNEYYKQATWDLNPCKDLNYKNIKDGNVFYRDSSNSIFYNYSVKKGKIIAGNVSGLLEISGYNGILNGSFSNYKFSGSIDANVNNDTYKGHVKGEMVDGLLVNGDIDATYNSGIKTYYKNGRYKGKIEDGVFEGTIDCPEFKGQVKNNIRTGTFFVNINSNLGKRDGSNTESYNKKGSLVGQWKNYNCIKGTANYYEDNHNYEGNISLINNEYKVDVKKDNKPFKSFKLPTNKYIEESLLLGIIDRISDIEMASIREMEAAEEARRIREEEARRIREERTERARKLEENKVALRQYKLLMNLTNNKSSYYHFSLVTGIDDFIDFDWKQFTPGGIAIANMLVSIKVDLIFRKDGTGVVKTIGYPIADVEDAHSYVPAIQLLKEFDFSGKKEFTYRVKNGIIESSIGDFIPTNNQLKFKKHTFHPNK